MDCTSLQAIFSGARADDLSDTEAAAFEQHLRACDRCRDALATAEEALEPLVDSMEPPAVPDAAWDKVTRAVKAEAARPVLAVHAGGGAGRAPRALAIAAAFLLAAGIGALLPLDMFRPSRNGATSGVPSSVDVPAPPPPSPGPEQGPEPLAPPTVKLTALSVDPPYHAEHVDFYDAEGKQVLLISVKDERL